MRWLHTAVWGCCSVGLTEITGLAAGLQVKLQNDITSYEKQGQQSNRSLVQRLSTRSRAATSDCEASICARLQRLSERGYCQKHEV